MLMRQLKFPALVSLTRDQFRSAGIRWQVSHWLSNGIGFVLVTQQEVLLLRQSRPSRWPHQSHSTSDNYKFRKNDPVLCLLYKGKRNVAFCRRCVADRFLSIECFHAVCPVRRSYLAIPLIVFEQAGGSSPGVSLALMTRPQLCR